MSEHDEDNERPELISAEGHKVQKVQYGVRIAASAKTRTVPTTELLSNVEKRLRELYLSGRIRVEKGREYLAPDVKAERDRLREQIHAIMDKLGPTRVCSGFVQEFHIHSAVYSFCPYLMWLDSFLRSTCQGLPLTGGPHAMRDRAIWYLWHYRTKAEIKVGSKKSRARQGWVECVSCGCQISLRRRKRDESGRSCCSKCGASRYRQIPNPANLKPIGRITKASLRRRFNLTIRELEKIVLLATPPELS